MSNGNAFERLFKLWAMVSKMVMDGKRDAEQICALLQGVVDVKSENPVDVQSSPPSLQTEESTDLYAVLCEPIFSLDLPQLLLLHLVRRGIRQIGNLVLETEQSLVDCCLSEESIDLVKKVLENRNLSLGSSLSMGHNMIFSRIRQEDQRSLPCVSTRTLCEWGQEEGISPSSGYHGSKGNE